MYYRKGSLTDISSCSAADTSKANALVNTAIEACTINDLGVVVLDELHMINDDHRGYLMELMASKLLVLENTVQIVGMSATLTVGSDDHVGDVLADKDRIQRSWRNGSMPSTTVQNMYRSRSMSTWSMTILSIQSLLRVLSSRLLASSIHPNRYVAYLPFVRYSSQIIPS